MICKGTMWRSAVLVLSALCCPGGGITAYVPKPSDCQYSFSHGMHGLDCSQLNFVNIPSSLSRNIQVLDMTFNRIRELLNSSFLPYSDLQYLYLEDNSISFIDHGAFEPLTDLELLDLSFNSLHYVPDALYTLSTLRILRLSRNPFGEVIFRDPLPSVEELDISGCKLRVLPALEALPRVVHLNVSSNKIKNVNIDQLAPLCRLRTLDLRGNKNLFMDVRQDGFCNCLLLNKWAQMRNFKTLPEANVICRNPRNALKIPVDNSTCFNNQTNLLFEESRLIAKSCEVGVLEYGSGPIRIRKSVIWTIGIFGACAVLLVCFASIYCVRRRQRAFPNETPSYSENRTFTKGGS